MENLLMIIPFVTHTLIGFYFSFFGFWNIYHWRTHMEMMVQKNLPHPWLILSIGIVWQTVLGFLIMLNLFVATSALLLIPFTLIAICLFHPFWQYRGEHRALHFTIFFTQLTITLSALLFLIARH